MEKPKPKVEEKPKPEPEPEKVGTHFNRFKINTFKCFNGTHLI